ncbi:DUF6538 domain-containing protein [Bradyrhizobium arachidis]|uniref:Tyr recombinase domain-containing protein n=1 Tax=Bradyrhizobium arachidis TaxID=858423 RepID=A0AAE7TGY7_9BRAD|nr:DUF6538 domain-containing protein [Bradyrhizobium arachidis]QOZ67286.1 hypothetical protein WN72_13920 [Bradyrhizobium arachidis]SFV16902.1 Phage integrase family protein [Bradyrhizobium arachidis]
MAFHIFRRQAVYYWRRRTPRALASVLGRPHLSMSLKTTNRAAACRLATQVNLFLDDVAMLADGADRLSRSQIETMLHAVVEKQVAKLDRVAFAAKNAPGFDVDQARSDDRRALWTYTLLDAQGHGAAVRPEDRDRMIADSLSEADIEAVKRHLTMLRANDMVPTKYHVLRQMIEGVQAVPTAMNMDVAQGTYFRGMRLALAESGRRYGGARVEDEGLVDRLLLAMNDPPKPIVAAAVPAVDRPNDPPKTDGVATILQFVPMADFSRFADGVIQQNAADGHWDEKTQRQAKSISNLFIKFMVQDQHIHDLNLVSQTEVGKFADFLRLEIYKHYGKSVRDERLTIEELREKGRSVERSKRGIGGDTLNRHWTFIGQIFDYAIARGSKSLEAINLTKLRAKSRGKNKRARDERAKLPIDSAKAIFQTPPFINSAGWDDLGKWGEEGAARIIHCALYFVPILIYYMGARREELCGAMVDDIIFDRDGCRPYIHIAANEQRRIKNAQSKRNIPLHPELIRLGFLDYVGKIKALGYKLLFPDLYSPSTRSPLGNRFYKLFKPILTAAKITEEGLGAHAVRHLFGAQLKKKLLSKEDRADLLGHGGDSETSERYCEPHELDTLFEFILKLEVITGHLKPHAITLIPWVENKEVAPFSQPSRAKRRSETIGGSV